MKIGIIPNVEKENTVASAVTFARLAKESGFECMISEKSLGAECKKAGIENFELLGEKELCEKSDVIISFGGDGTMLNTAYIARESGTPILGVNFGKLGFLAEFDFKDIKTLIRDLKEGNFTIEERMALEAVCRNEKETPLFAVNDIVIDRGRWPKMMEMTLKVDGHYVSTFSADGLIVATPTGSTGYSLSTGGPIVSPKAGVITLNPISSHTLTMRPLVLSSEQKITVEVKEHQSAVQINSDGQRVNYYEPPVTIEIWKSEKPVKLVHSLSRNYFDILRQKLFWGLDVRSNKEENNEN